MKYSISILLIGPTILLKMNNIVGTANKLTMEELEITFWKAYLEGELERDFPQININMVIKNHQDNTTAMNAGLIWTGIKDKMAHNASNMK